MPNKRKHSQWTSATRPSPPKRMCSGPCRRDDIVITKSTDSNNDAFKGIDTATLAEIKTELQGVMDCGKWMRLAARIPITANFLLMTFDVGFNKHHDSNSVSHSENENNREDQELPRSETP